MGSQQEAQLSVKSNQMGRKASERCWTSDVKASRNTSGVQECGDKNSSYKKKEKRYEDYARILLVIFGAVAH